MNINPSLRDSLILTKVKNEVERRGWSFEDIEYGILEDGQPYLNILTADKISYEEAIDFYNTIFAYAEEVEEEVFKQDYPIWVTPQRSNRK